MKKGLLAVKLFAAVMMVLMIVSFVPTSGVKAQAAVRGIDVSQWQGDINWNAVAASGVNYAMVRIGNTAYGMDSKFVQNVIGANAAGIRVGAYVYTYAKNVMQAAADAQLAINAMANLPISFPVAIDLEDPSLRSLSGAEQQAIINTFCTMIYAAGYTPMVYSYRSWFVDRIGVTIWDQWIADYADTCLYPGPYAIWQATDKGSVSGIGGYVDIDYLYKDYFSTIIPQGLSTQNGRTYYFVNYRRMTGFQNVNGVMYFFAPDGAMVKDQTTVDAAGNITRICKDGRVVVISAQAQALAAQAKAAADLAAAAQAQADVQAAAAAQGAAEFTARLAVLQQQKAELEQLFAAATAQAQALPTPENLQAQAAAEAQYTQFAAAMVEFEAQTANAQQTAAGAQAIAQQKAAEAQQALLTAQAAAAAIVIPD